MKKHWFLYKSEILKKKFGDRFVDIGVENVAVAAARVVERPPRCSNNKGVKKRRCLQNACVNHFVRDRKAARAWELVTNLKIRQNPYSQRLVWGIRYMYCGGRGRL